MAIKTFDVPKFVEENSQYDTTYRRSAKWNPATGDFVRDGANRVKECSGYEAFAIWCYKVAMTERYRCLAYSDAIGTEMERAMSNDSEGIVESMVQRTITDALKVNPRTEYVGGFNFQWDGDIMHCKFKVKGVNLDDEITIAI